MDSTPTTSIRARSLSSAFAWPNLDPEIAQRLRPVLVLALLYFKSPLDVNRVRDLMQQRLVYKHFRFRSVPRRDGLSVHLDEMHPSAIDMEHHIRDLPEAAGWGQREIDAFVSKEYAASKDVTMPLWMFYVMNNLADGRSCILVNIDHSIGDGISLVQTLLSLLDREVSPSAAPVTGATNITAEGPGVGGPQPSAGATPHRHTHNHKRRLVKLYSVWDAVTNFVQGLALPFFDSLLPGDTPNKLKIKNHREPGLIKRAAFAEKISLAKVKEVKNKFPGATVNDILTAVLVMMVRRYLESVNDPILARSDSLLRGNFPINMRRNANNPSVIPEAGNNFASGAFTFDFSYKDRVDLVWRVKRQIDLIKISPQPLISKLLVDMLVPILPKEILANILLDMFGKFTIMMSNVPGPQSEAHFGGQPIDELSFLSLGVIGTYCGICTYNGHVYMSICCNEDTEPHPGLIARFWKEEFDALYDEVMKHTGSVPVPTFASPASPVDWAVVLGFAALLCAIGYRYFVS